MNERLDTLKRVSGLPVTVYTGKGVKYFVFGPENQPLKTICTYRKAKVFAEGVAIGRALKKPEKQKPECQSCQHFISCSMAGVTKCPLQK